jgi:two-component system chemotaxis response regulator CheB
MVQSILHNAIVIGASAGGIEALDFLLPHIKSTCKHSLFVVQHIGAGSEFSFVKLLNAKCKIKIKEACDTEEIKPGMLYFAPPDYHLLIEKNYSLTLSADEKVNFSRPSIDVLFETAAEAYTNALTGILLTGSNNDGSKGLKRIKELGGKTIIQEPHDAAFSEMPASALTLFTPDKIVTLKQLAHLLENL